ncbi:uncharacterized protein LOC143566609 [Bidens hawaiensis]|uniref:uncharacterized protein LOC143566609 n=1 Tax=Bidens hawaiensis TaxID=980011 RepID=UPI004049E11E
MDRLQYSNLCHLIHDSLHPFTVKSITKEQEKAILITLSQVLNKIKLWTAEFDSDSGSGFGSGSDSGSNVINNIHDHSSASHCILKIINQLVLLLAVESEFVQHLAANVVVSVSEFVMASGSYWEEFMQSLCSYFELIFCKVLSPSSDRPFRAKTPGFDSKDFTLDLQRVLDNATWHSAGAVVLILRAILKQLKHEDDVESLEIYFQVLGSCLEVIPWDAYNISLVVDINEKFCGYLVQLLCSLADSEDENRAVRVIFNVFPKTLTWFFGKEESYNNTSMSRYIRHKILVLMIRLSYAKLDCETAVSWLHIIEKYFQDLLSEPVTEPESDQDDCLKDSPFNETSYRHLQRRVIFIYLKCAFSLIGLKDKREKQCSCGNMNSCSQSGFTALYEWVKKHLSVNILDNHELYDERCKSFTKSFIRLYMHEDDMLFKVLLQLTYAPFGHTQAITDDRIPEVVAKDIPFLLSDVFDPVCLFHLFLSELHYDHQVLLDYLISKDTGASCAEYLLRCLRIVCDKWDSFLKFPFRVEAERQPFHKRRKFESEKACENAFSNPRDCLLLLKKSLESLHKKDLFPYNPQVLLRRLTRFQELCLNKV